MSVNNHNIQQITDFSVLKNIVSNNLTVVIGLTCPESTTEAKIMIKKFLKRKSELFPLIQFVYMDLSADQILKTKLEIVKKDYDLYPLVYYIRDGNKILCTVTGCTEELAYETFDELSPIFKREMKEFSEKAKNIQTTKTTKTNKTTKSAKKSNVIFNIDSEAEIEIEKAKDSDVSMVNHNPNLNPNPNSNPNSNLNSNLNPNAKTGADEKEELDPQTKMAIEREKMMAIEKEYNKMQKKMLNEVKNRIKIERHEEKEKMKEKDKDKEKNKEKDKGKNKKDPVYNHNTKPAHDNIGNTNNNSTVIAKQNRNKRR